MKKSTFYSFTSRKALLLFLMCAIPIIIFFVYYVNNSVSAIQKNQNEIIDTQLGQAVTELNDNIHQINLLKNSIYANNMLNNFFLKDFFTDIELILKYNKEILPTVSWIHLLKPSCIESIEFYTQNTQIPRTTYIFSIDSSSELSNKRFHQVTLIDDNAVIIAPMNARFANKNTYLYITLNTNKLFETIKLFANNTNSCLKIYTEDNEAMIKSTPIDIIVPAYMETMENNSTALIDKKLFLLKKFKFEYGISITLLIPLDTATEEINSVIRTFLIVFVLTIFALGIVFILYFYLSLKRLNTIIHAVNNINTVSFDINIPHANKDIIDSLANSINMMSQKIKNLIDEVYVAELNEKKMKISVLQKQINPHFLYNILECIRMKSEINDQEDISRNIESLGVILRNNISVGKNFETIENEIKLLYHYISIQNLINNNQIEFTVETNEINTSKLIPRLCLQPIIENSIEHGHDKNNGKKLKISLKLREDAGALLLIIEDNGSGISAENLIRINDSFLDFSSNITLDLSSGVALKNINSRIKILYGESYGLSIQLTDNNGVRVVIRLPGDL